LHTIKLRKPGREDRALGVFETQLDFVLTILSMAKRIHSKMSATTKKLWGEQNP
jgi:hypothetical protein